MSVVLHADAARADAVALVLSVEHSTVRNRVKVLHVRSSQPETEEGGGILARAIRTLALHERLPVEVLQTASCRCQRPSTSLVP